MPKITTIAVVGAMVFAAACSGQGARPDSGVVSQARELFGALPKVMASPDNPVTPEKAALGKALFYESRISVDGTVSCARCHPLSLYAVDGLPKSVGNRCRVSPRNAPTVLNAAGQISAHWVGNRTGVEDQAIQSLVGAPSFGMASHEAAEARLRAIPGYVVLFEKAFPGEANPVTAKNFALAVGAFERTLVTPGPFDAFIGGDGASLTAGQKRGLKDFIDTGCAGCHSGAALGGADYEKFGVREPYWTRTSSAEVDEGRYGVTKDEADRYVFKVPILRNVEMTAPYFHDGSVGRLADAVRIMGQVQLGAELGENEIGDLVEFLRSLTGRIPAAALEVPVLPPDISAPAATGTAPVHGPGPDPGSGAELSPNEDLMQEHALLERVLLIYEEMARRLEAGKPADPEVLGRAASIIRLFIEEYHERLEEERVFPLFEKAGPLAELVRVLREQHRAGRVLTKGISERSTEAVFGDPAARRDLAADIRAFIRMYRPHAAREGSVLFPAFRGLLPAKEFLELGETFEAKEHEALGAAGFEGQVALVAELEKMLGIDDLSRFTPQG